MDATPLKGYQENKKEVQSARDRTRKQFTPGQRYNFTGRSQVYQADKNGALRKV